MAEWLAGANIGISESKTIPQQKWTRNHRDSLWAFFTITIMNKVKNNCKHTNIKPLLFVLYNTGTVGA